MYLNNQKQQNPVVEEEGKKGSNSIVKKFALKKTAPRRLSLELECEIFKFLRLKIQQKLIWGMGAGIYEIFRQNVLTKSKRLQNPEQNGWEVSSATISSNRLLATGFWQNVFAERGFPITGQLSRTDNFPGTVFYYFEVTITLSAYWRIYVGLAGRNIPNGSVVGSCPNSYAIQSGFDHCWLSGNYRHPFQWRKGAIKPTWNGKGDVLGCGLLLNSENKLSLLFTGNGILMGLPIPISPTVNILYPIVSMYGVASVEANFVGNRVNPFKYDIEICPETGMVFK